MQWIDSISDTELLDYLPQLVQVCGGTGMWRGVHAGLGCGMRCMPRPGHGMGCMPGPGGGMGCMLVLLCPKTVPAPGPEVRVLPGQPAGALPYEASNLRPEDHPLLLLVG